MGESNGRNGLGAREFSVTADDLVILAQRRQRAKMARDVIGERDARIAEAVTDDGLEVAAVAKAAELTPAEVAAIIFAQESNPSPMRRLRRSARARSAPPSDDRRRGDRASRPPARRSAQLADEHGAGRRLRDAAGLLAGDHERHARRRGR